MECYLLFFFGHRNGQMFNRVETVFHYKQTAQPRYVLALDKSSPMDERVSLPPHKCYVHSGSQNISSFIFGIDFVLSNGSQLCYIISKDHWKYVRSATRRLVLHDLADDTELGILSFADTVQIHTVSGGGHNGAMVRLASPGSREQVASAIPVFISTAGSTTNTGTGSAGTQESCLTCALAEAIAVR